MPVTMRRLALLGLLFAGVGAMAAGGMSFESQAIEKKHPFSNTALLFSVDDQNLEFQCEGVAYWPGPLTRRAAF